MTRLRNMLACLILTAAMAGAQSPFHSQAQLLTKDGAEMLRVEIAVPPGNHLYASELRVHATEPTTVTLTPLGKPKTKRIYDELFEKDIDVIDADLVLSYRVEGRQDAPLKVTVSYQGCSEQTCFLPQEDTFLLASPTQTAEAIPEAAALPLQGETGGKGLAELADRFELGGQATGYLAPAEFLAFLDQAQTGTVTREEDRVVQRVFRRYGLLAVMVLLIPFGFMLNLTPCVLPMIPINLAIIGAGVQSGSRHRGFALGAVYGAGMAAVYGLLGLVVVLTGEQFGALNASPWFSLAIAIVFGILALAMFDVYVIDLSRFQRRSAGNDDTPKAPFVTAFLLGGTAALLAGACVAPVLISVLVLAANLYRTNPAALLLPFMLGVGMALPWPFAGAGLSFLPRPGAWMDWVKRLFGVLILLAALYYAQLAVRQFMPSRSDDARHRTDVAAALQQGLDENKPVLLDFWSLSCKACKKMDKEVFPKPEVAARLQGFVFAGVQADLAEREDVRWALEHFDIKGLPTYVVLTPQAPTMTGK